MQAIKDRIRSIPDFPKKGIMFRDITTLLADPDGLRMTIDAFCGRYSSSHIDAVVGIEARGFILGSAVAYNLGVGFVPVRKKGKLPGAVERYEYELEYGTDMIEIHSDALKKGARVLLIDDLLATGGTCLAAAKLVEKIGGVVEEVAFIVDLPALGGRVRLEKEGYRIFSLCEFEGD
ncbi:MAG: adenine phosphoribosyltransferase [Spirochaetota bacterium]